MKTTLIAAITLLPVLASAQDKFKVLIIDGQNNHNWKATTPVLKEALETSVFTVDVATSPAKGSKGDAWNSWNPKFSDYDAVVSNYNGEMWPKAEQENFDKYVGGGGALVVIHAADNSFGKWKEYNEMIAVGGWGGRKLSKDGTWLHAVDGKIVRDDTTEGGCGQQGELHQPFTNSSICNASVRSSITPKRRKLNSPPGR